MYAYAVVGNQYDGFRWEIWHDNTRLAQSDFKFDNAQVAYVEVLEICQSSATDWSERVEILEGTRS